MICDHASGSRCSASSIESFTSAKRTVTCLRSPSTVAFAWRIFSARSGAWAGDGVVVRPLIVSARAAAAAEFLADLDRGAAGGTPHGQFGAALCAEATVEPVVVVTGRTAHWVLGQLVVADRDDLELFDAARRSHRDDVADLCLQERRRDRRDPRDALETRVTLPFLPVSGGAIGRDRCGRGALRPTARASAPRPGRRSIGPRGRARPHAGRRPLSDSGRRFR